MAFSKSRENDKNGPFMFLKDGVSKIKIVP